MTRTSTWIGSRPPTPRRLPPVFKREPQVIECDAVDIQTFAIPSVHRDELRRKVQYLPKLCASHVRDHSLSRRAVSTISTTPATVSERAQSRCSSLANETQLTGWPPACTTRSRPARCASSEVPPIASTTGYTS